MGEETGNLEIDNKSNTSSQNGMQKTDIVEQELLHSYSIRPKISQKFRSAEVKELLHSILLSTLADKEYNTETFTELSRSICVEIKEKLKTEEIKDQQEMGQMIVDEVSDKLFYSLATIRRMETCF